MRGKVIGFEVRPAQAEEVAELRVLVPVELAETLCLGGPVEVLTADQVDEVRETVSLLRSQSAGNLRRLGALGAVL